MTALAATRSTPKMADAPIPDLIQLPVKGTKKIYQGALVVINTATGYAEPASAALGLIAVGRAEALADNSGGADGAISVLVNQGVFKWANSAAGDLIAQTNAGVDCYLVDDATVALTDNNGARSRAGKIIQVDTDGVWVQTFIGVRDINGVNGAPAGGSMLGIPIDLVSIAAGQLVGSFVPGFAGRIVKAQIINTKVATGAGATAALQIRIGGVNITGGIVTPTLANQTPVGNVTAGTAITGANVFTAAQGIDVQASTVTVFTAGSALLVLTFA